MNHAIPLGWELPNDRKYTIVWAVRIEDCYACVAPKTELRRLTRKLAADLRLVVMPNGAPTDLLKAFLATERIAATIVPVTSNDYGRVFRTATIPAMYLIVHDTVLAEWSGQRAVTDRPISDGTRRVIGQIDAFVTGSGAQGSHTTHDEEE